jgi:betaine reductase
MENLMAKASGGLVLKHLLKQAQIGPEEIDFILSCSEEAVGDRYNRGGGSLSKAIGEMCGCINATGCDIKAFCAAPIYAIVNAAGLVKSGVFKRVAVVGGGCLAKLGMKFKGHLSKDMPILEDVLGGIAFLITEDDGESPVLRLDSVGKHDIGSGSSQQHIMESLVVKPLDRIGKKVTEVDKYGTEMHNPEVTLPSGSGNVPLNNYRMIGALAALRKEIDKSEINEFVLRHGMPRTHTRCCALYGPCHRCHQAGGNEQRHVCLQREPVSGENVPALGWHVLSHRDESGQKKRKELILIGIME